MIELYGMTSPNVTKVLLMLEELGRSYTFHHLNVFRGDQFDPSFQALNPAGKIPVIVDTDLTGKPQIVFESSAILIYLAEGSGRLLAPAGVARYETLQWLMVQACQIGPLFGQFTHFRRLAPPGNDYSLLRYGNLATRLYQLLESRLATRSWLAGDDYSIADIATYPWMRYVEWHGLDWASFPNLKKWADAIGARPAAQRANNQQAEMRPIDLEAMSKASPIQMERYLGRIL